MGIRYTILVESYAVHLKSVTVGPALKGGGSTRPPCSRGCSSATVARMDEWGGGSCSSRVPLQEPPTSSVWFVVNQNLAVPSARAGPGSTRPSPRLAASAGDLWAIMLI